MAIKNVTQKTFYASFIRGNDNIYKTLVHSKMISKLCKSRMGEVLLGQSIWSASWENFLIPRNPWNYQVYYWLWTNAQSMEDRFE